MKKQRTIYHLIVDKSGSMSDCIPQTIEGYNEQINMIRNLEAEFPEQDFTIGLTTFNNDVDHKYFMQLPGTATLMSNSTYIPQGGTALYDAIGLSINSMQELQEISTSQLPTTVVVVILTDGHENSSRLFNLSRIKQLISQLEETGNWTFSFIGATLDAVDRAEEMSIKRSNSMAFSKSSMKEQVWDRLNLSMRSYSDKKSKGQDTSNLF